MLSVSVKNELKIHDLEETTSVPTSNQASIVKLNSRNGTRNSIPTINSTQSNTKDSLISSKQSINRRNSSLTVSDNKTIDTASLQKKQLISKDREIAGFWKQLRILTWKNLVLSKRNACGLLTEILAPLFIIIILIVIRYFIDATQNYDQANGLYNVFDLFPITNTSNATLLLYYPNNSFIQGIVNNSVTLIKMRKPFFNVNCKYKLFAVFDKL